MKKTIKSILPLIAVMLLSGVFIHGAYAMEPLLQSTEGAEFSEGCLDSGNCRISDFTILLIRVSQIILGLTGSLSLLAFVYGGTLFLVSSGNKETVEKAKSTLIGAVIGIFIVFASYTIIGFVFSAFQIEGGEEWSSSTWFN